MIQSEPYLNIGIATSECLEIELKGIYEWDGEKIENCTYTFSESLPENSSTNIKTFPTLFEAKHPTSKFILRNVSIGIGFHWERKKDLIFEGNLKIIKKDNQYTAVNVISTEKYLRSVISSEMSANAHPEYLQAHTIVSRSWLFAQIENKKHKKHELQGFQNDSEICKWYDFNDHTDFDLCADDHCQRYHGLSRVISTKAEDAVKATYGQTLTFENKICDARFSKCCGGISEKFENVWQDHPHPYLLPIVDRITSTKFNFPQTEYDFSVWIKQSHNDFCNTIDKTILLQVLVDFDQETNDFYRWKVQYSQKELAEILKDKSNIDFGSIVELKPLSRGKSGRIVRLKIIGTKCTRIVGKELEIRKWLSKTHLFSSAFVVETTEYKDNLPGKFTLFGAGWGHGVGFCQIGAAVMSAKGYTCKEIIEHYFPSSTIKKLY